MTGLLAAIALFALGLSVLVVGGPGPPVHDAAAPADRGRRAASPRATSSRRVPIRPGPGRVRRSWPSWPSSSTRWPTASRRASRSSAATATGAATSWPTSRTSCGRRSPRCARSTSCCTEGAGDDPDARAEFLESSGQQIERLDWLAQNLLELSKLDSGLVLLDLRPDDLRAAVETAVEQSTAAARKRGVTLRLRLPAAPIRIRHDPQRIGQVVANLVGNAVKFTPRGGSVAVDARSRRPTARGSRSPTRGVGIDPAELPHIFERFYRGSRANEARGSGSGLGLAIVRSIVDMHGGTVAVESRVGEGSRFTVEPAARPAPGRGHARRPMRARRGLGRAAALPGRARGCAT